MFVTPLDRRVDEILDACTRCGKCVEACPMPGIVGIEAADPGAVAGGVLGILRTGAGPEDAVRWASACTGSGRCIPTCEDGVNPRFMLSMARRAMKKRDKSAAERRADGAQRFKAMSDGVKVLSRLQLPPAALARLDRRRGGRRRDPAPEIVFWTGCQVLKTPHIALLCLEVLDRIEVRYVVHGGPGDCCGIPQMRGGDDDGAGRLGGRSAERFAATGAPEVVCWCPTCLIQFEETVLPGFKGGAPFRLSLFGAFLDRRLEQLRSLFSRPVRRRVGLHLHGDVAGANGAVRRILEAIPGLDLVDIRHEMASYMCSRLATVPGYLGRAKTELFDAAESAGVDTLAVVFHACYRELCDGGKDRSFDVVNYMELVGEAIGVRHEPLFKTYKLLEDPDRVIAEGADLIARHGMDAAEVRAVVASELFGERQAKGFPAPDRGPSRRR